MKEGMLACFTKWQRKEEWLGISGVEPKGRQVFKSHFPDFSESTYETCPQYWYFAVVFHHSLLLHFNIKNHIFIAYACLYWGEGFIPWFKVLTKYFVEGTRVRDRHGHEVSERYDVTGIFKAKEAELTCRFSSLFPTIYWEYPNHIPLGPRTLFRGCAFGLGDLWWEPSPSVVTWPISLSVGYKWVLSALPALGENRVIA